ncbi:MAG: hypothetical protein JWM05_2543, partial [Acidimicrobiales bacterium]|nr:hypothetical protein [Acidimicrobiales bacterium]
MFSAELVQRIDVAASDPSACADGDLSALVLDAGRLKAQVVAAEAKLIAEFD